MFIEILAKAANPQKFNLNPQTVFDIWLMDGEEIIRKLASETTQAAAKRYAWNWARENGGVEDVIVNNL